MLKRLLLKSDMCLTINEASTVDDGLALYDKENFDIILLDYRMPQKNGVEMILEVRAHLKKQGSAIVMLSSANDDALATECLKAGAQDFIPKSEVTVSRIQNALIHAQTRFELEMELRESYLTSKKIAERDALTGLANRFVFDEALQVAVANNARSEFKLGLIMIDIDHFKSINDVHGHDVGDQVLIEVANRISEALRKNELFSRIGGDEFAIMITNLKDVYHLNEIARRVVVAFEEPFKTEHALIQIELSIGIALHPDKSVDSKELIKCSDVALYRAKTKLGSQICFFYPEMQEKLLRRYEIERVLRSAITNEQLVLFYQPILNTKTKALIGFEALLRLNASNNLQSGPDEFIPIAEQIGVIIDLGSWVIEAAVCQLDKWNKSFKQSLTMSINLSAIQLESSSLINTITGAIDKYGISPSALEFEITETAFIKSTDIIIRRINAIRDIGCKIALDDFGTGYSSISHLLMFPITTIKLDKSIIPHSVDDSKGYILVEALITLAKKLKLEMVAEGIEQEFQLAFMQLNGVHRSQGYLFMKPMPSLEIERAYLDD